MKTTAFVTIATLASASAFAPNSQGRSTTSLAAEKKSFFSTVFGMDLFAPQADQNDYGARNKKNIGTGSLGANSYIPDGLSKAEYEAVRKGEDKKKADNYQKNVAKAEKFLDYTQFYLDRGTDVNDDWAKNKNTLGHRMAKTKYDWTGQKTDESKGWFSK